MKTLFVGIFAMLITSVAMASGNLKVNMADSDSEATVMNISNSEMVKYEIELQDAWGNQIYEMNTEIPRSEINKHYDLSNLENGTYWYSVKTGDEEIRKQLSINYGEVEVMDVRKTVDPYFHQEGDQVKFTYLNYESENIKLYVYDNNTLLEEVSLGKDFTIHKMVNLSDLNAGEYDIVLANDYNIYEHSVVID
ncbi:T9SS type A sorting domain-containing protein [uncultured Draconibacterium sp.]|uniref:T9SS type A sorting domain-containing protein n=1 Tax=uncultured Draconibacterium sp. TaxID=1573823 RepID=UPI0029C69259|nr:T9SS type A sorting domain-containing protein [uncultured Draconibacterium sp.]